MKTISKYYLTAFILVQAAASTHAASFEGADFSSMIENSKKISCRFKKSLPLSKKKTKIVFETETRIVSGVVNRNDDPVNNYWRPQFTFDRIGKDYPWVITGTAGWRLQGNTIYYSPMFISEWDGKKGCKDHQAVVMPNLSTLHGNKFLAELRFRWCHPHTDYGLQETSTIELTCKIDGK